MRVQNVRLCVYSEYNLGSRRMLHQPTCLKITFERNSIGMHSSEAPVHVFFWCRCTVLSAHLIFCASVVGLTSSNDISSSTRRYDLTSREGIESQRSLARVSHRCLSFLKSVLQSCRPLVVHPGVLAFFRSTVGRHFWALDNFYQKLCLFICMSFWSRLSLSVIYVRRGLLLSHLFAGFDVA